MEFANGNCFNITGSLKDGSTKYNRDEMDSDIEACECENRHYMQASVIPHDW